MPEVIPAAIQSLLREHIRTIAQLELLLKLHGQPQQEWSVEEAAKELYTAPSMTGPLLEALRASGLVERIESDGRRYRYAPKSEELAKTVDDLSQIYEQRRITIINLIYSAPIKNLQDFADAFRFRKKEGE